jgi:cyclophilin family peptidyl-prolyl cis-trans isomerase
MRYTRLHVWVIFSAIVIGIIMLLKCSTGPRGIYKSSSPVTDSLVTAVYPDLYGAIFQRDARQFLPFLSHQSPEVREQAWRALSNTPTDSLASFIDLAKEQNTEVAWFGISMHSLTESQLRDLEQSWLQNPELRSGIARVLGQQGDEQSMDFLLDQFDVNNPLNDYHLGLATGRLVTRLELSHQDQIKIIRQAFAVDDEQITRAYLYGWYRNPANELTSVARDTLYTRWQVFGTGTSSEVDQFVNRILKERTTHTMTIFYNGEQWLDDEIQLSYELAQSLDELDLNNDHSLAAKILLTTANPHVQVRTLQSITGKIEEGDALFNYISREMITDGTLTDVIWLQAIETIVQVDTAVVSDHQDRLNRIQEENAYLLPEVLAVYEDAETIDQYLRRIENIVNDQNPQTTMYALQTVNAYWEMMPEEERTDERVKNIREITFQALSLRDRGVAFMAQPLLQKSDIFNSDDFERINNSLTAFTLPDDIEVYQSFGSLYMDRFENQAEPVIDSLASLGYAPLNRSLADAGWDVDMPEESSTDFRTPDWNRLWELGRNPVWTIRTEKGDIEVELNTLSAPATVSAIDSLSRAGAYDGVPFHRVVPNFVIQGGDIERKDGFGGPEFVIPTEGSEQEFLRGAIGIASAGTDTEGSQYFIMHQWKPHLNGNYTRFGKVISGMDVVDRITVGDKVLSTTWY